MKEKIKSVDEYIASKSLKIQAFLTKLRMILKDALPEAKEMIAWNMPSYKGKKYIAHFEAYKDHVNVYFGPTIINMFKDKEQEFKFTERGVSLLYNKEIPAKLIKEMAFAGLHMIEDDELEI